MMEKEPKDFNLPENIREYLKRFCCNVQINICRIDVLNGYGIRYSVRVVLSQYYEECTRKNCKYHSLFNQTFNEDNGKHRHRYRRGYEDVFFWAPESGKSLEEAFDLFLEFQPENATREALVCAGFLDQETILSPINSTENSTGAMIK